MPNYTRLFDSLRIHFFSSLFMKICYFFLKSKKDLGGRKILFTLWAFSKSQRVEEYKGQTQFFLAISLKRSLCNVIGMLSFRKYHMILMGKGDLYFFFQFDKIMHYFISILEHCTQLNYTLHSKYHTYIGENFKKIRIEKNIIQNCN